MIFPEKTFNNKPLHAGQKAVICNRYVEQYRIEHNTCPLQAAAVSTRTDFDAIVPEAYRKHKLVWLHTKWQDACNGNATLGFPGIPLDTVLEATEKKNTAYQAWRKFAKWQREEHGATIKMLMYERHEALEECKNDTTHNPTLADFSTVGGKKRLRVPSRIPDVAKVNESTNLAFAMRSFVTIPDMDNEHRDAVFEAIAEAKQMAKDSTYWDSKMDKELVRTNTNMPEPPDPKENYPLFSDILDTGSAFTITTNKIVFDAVAKNITSYVADDKGIDHFSGDFSHTFAYTTGAVSGTGVVNVWGLANDLNDFGTLISLNKSHFSLMSIRGATNEQIYLREIDGSTNYNDITPTFGTIGDKHWYNPERDMGVGTYGTLYNYTYNDVDMTDLFDTLSITLHSSIKKFRRIYGFSSHNIASADTFSGEVEDLDLQEAIIIPRRRMEGY